MKGLDSAIKTIEKAGFSHIKVELEATLHRRNNEFSDAKSCGDCDGLGYIVMLNGKGMPQTKEECATCKTSGLAPGGRTYNFGNTGDCQMFIAKNLSKETVKVINFMKFYLDGSVDSELTFTLPTKESYRIPEVIEAWNKLAEANGNGCETTGAGMHIAVLTTGVYPCTKRMDSEKLDNFSREVTKLLPALFIAGTSGNFTRALKFRMPQIAGGGRESKYSAIYLGNYCSMEYRLFETCYQRPEAIFEFIGVIARTLEFYIDPTKKVTSLGKTFPFYDHRGMEGFTQLPEQVEILKKTFKHIKPEGMTVKEFMAHRKINLSITASKSVNAVRINQLKKAYKERLRAYEDIRKKPLDQYQLDNMVYYKRENPSRDEEWCWRQVTGQSATIEDEQTFIKQNIRTERPTLSVAV